VCSTHHLHGLCFVQDAIKYENGREVCGSSIIVEWAKGNPRRSGMVRRLHFYHRDFCLPLSRSLCSVHFATYMFSFKSVESLCRLCCSCTNSGTYQVVCVCDCRADLPPLGEWVKRQLFEYFMLISVCFCLFIYLIFFYSVDLIIITYLLFVLLFWCSPVDNSICKYACFCATDLHGWN
jgi:hypothetical protein